MKHIHKNYTIILAIAVSFLAGCAAQAPYLKLDASLQKDIKSFDGVQYVGLARLCDAYGLDYKWDTFIKTATIEKGSNRIVLRAGSDNVLVNDIQKSIGRPVILSGGAAFVPLSFVRTNIIPIAAAAPVKKAVEVSVPKRFTIRTIVLDPGHGGKDPGAIGKKYKIKEKVMTLALAKKLKAMLEKAGIKVIMTRNDDTFISLPRRAQIANSSGADLFVSVHINASRSKLLRGFECYYLSNATDDNARAIEAFENSSLKMDEEAEVEHSSRLDKTLWDMALTENRRESSELAGYICSSVDQSFTIRSRGIRSARFYVLKHTNMPSVLVETAYISNRYEEMKLKDPNFLGRIADAIVQGILRYKSEYERTEGFTKS